MDMGLVCLYWPPALDVCAFAAAPYRRPRLRNWRLVTILTARSENVASPPAAVISVISGRSDAMTVRPRAYPIIFFDMVLMTFLSWLCK